MCQSPCERRGPLYKLRFVDTLRDAAGGLQIWRLIFSQRKSQVYFFLAFILLLHWFQTIFNRIKIAICRLELINKCNQNIAVRKAKAIQKADECLACVAGGSEYPRELRSRTRVQKAAQVARRMGRSLVGILLAASPLAKIPSRAKPARE